MSTLFDDLFEFIENYNIHGIEKPTLRFQVLELIKLLHHYGSDTIRSGVEEELEYVNQRNDAIQKNSARHYKKALEVMLKICDTGTCQSSIYEIIGKAERDQVLYEEESLKPQKHSNDRKDDHTHPTLPTNISRLASGADRFKSRSNVSAKREQPGIKELADAQIAAQTFTFRELAAVTNNFRPESFIAEGGFGRVYKGRLENTGQVVAVKQMDRDGLQGNREFLVEVLILSLLHHSNLVSLIGYCADGDQRLLVYEFMPLGSLEDHLHDLPPEKEPLDWNTRMKIAAGAAKGLEFLHDKASPPVICRDIKSSNILLEEGFHPKLSDFGFAKLSPTGDKSHVFTSVKGTYGYCAPEYVMTGRVTVQSDVYSFGVVLLELITGRKAFDSTRPQEQQNLVAWARPLFVDQKKFATFADPRLQGQYPMRGLYQAVAVASMCIQEEDAARPLIRNVVAALSNLANHVYEISSAPGHGYRLCEDRGDEITKAV